MVSLLGIGGRGEPAGSDWGNAATVEQAFLDRCRDKHVDGWPVHGLGRFFCACPPHLRSLTARVEDSGIGVLFCGFTFDDADGTEAIARRILTEYRVRGFRFAKSLAGHFVIVITDEARGCVNVYVDAVASIPIYYHSWKETVIFSSELKHILPIGKPNKMWCREAIQQSYLLGYVLDEYTVCEEVKYLPGGRVLVVGSDGKHKSVVYHRLGQLEPDQGDPKKTGFAEVADRYLAGSVDNVYRKFSTLGCRPLVTVSGGLDSRAVLSLLRRSHEGRIDTVAWGQSASKDHIYGESVARIVGAQHLAFPYSDGAWLLDNMDASISSTECMYSYMDAARIHFMAGKIPWSGFAPLYTGLSGDMVMGSFVNWRDIVRNPGIGNWKKIAARLMVEYTNVSFQGFDQFRLALGDEPVEFVQSNLERSLENTYERGEDYFGFLDRWNLLNKQARGILAYFRGAAKYAPAFSPFYHPRLIAFAMNLPVRFRFSEAAYVQYLLENVFEKQLARIPWQKSGIRTLRGMYLNVAAILGLKLIKRIGHKRHDPFNLANNANPYNLWFGQNSDLRTRVCDELGQSGAGESLFLDERRLRKSLEAWYYQPQRYGSLTLNFVYMMAYVRFASQYGKHLSR